MHAAVEALGDLQLKVGIHSGACIAVANRDRLDWYGSTVNLAARVQAQAGPGETCISESMAHALRDANTLPETEVFETQVRGIDESIRIHRHRSQR
jgi:class 3 adenylate cyclase